MRKRSNAGLSGHFILEPFGDHFRWNIEKGHPKRLSKNRSRKSIEKLCRYYAKMMSKWMPKSMEFHICSQKGKTLETICFTIENVLLGTVEFMQTRWKIYSSLMLEKGMQKVWKIMPKWIPNGGPNRSTNWKYATKGIKNKSRKNAWFLEDSRR